MSKISFLRLAILTCLLSALCFSSCKGHLDPGTTQQGTVVGTWQCFYADYGTLSEDAVGMIMKDDKLILNDDGIYYLDGKRMKQSGSWSIDDNKLRIVSSDMTLIYSISELTSAMLSMYTYINGQTLKFSFIRV